MYIYSVTAIDPTGITRRASTHFTKTLSNQLLPLASFIVNIVKCMSIYILHFHSD